MFGLGGWILHAVLPLHPPPQFFFWNLKANYLKKKKNHRLLKLLLTPKLMETTLWHWAQGCLPLSTTWGPFLRREYLLHNGFGFGSLLSYCNIPTDERFPKWNQFFHNDYGNCWFSNSVYLQRRVVGNGFLYLGARIVKWIGIVLKPKLFFVQRPKSTSKVLLRLDIFHDDL